MVSTNAHKKKKERMYKVSLIFLSIIVLDVIVTIALHVTSSFQKIHKINVCTGIDSSDVQLLIANLPEVKEFEQSTVENGKIFNLALSTLGNTWTVEVFATGSSEKEEFNHYTIDGCGRVRCSKKMYYGATFIRNAEENEFPCASLYDTTQKN